MQKSSKKNNLFIYFASISLLFFSTKPISSDEFNLEWSDSYTSPTTTIQGSIEFDPDNFRSKTLSGQTGISNLDSFSLNIGQKKWKKDDLTNFRWTDSVGLDFTKGKLSFDAKRNLLSNSAEFYDLSYEYINDCLRAGLAFRREFYKDRDLEPEDSLIFKVTFTPLGTITTPSY